LGNYKESFLLLILVLNGHILVIGGELVVAESSEMRVLVAVLP